MDTLLVTTPATTVMLNQTIAQKIDSIQEKIVNIFKILKIISNHNNTLFKNPHTLHLLTHNLYHIVEEKAILQCKLKYLNKKKKLLGFRSKLSIN